MSEAAFVSECREVLARTPDALTHMISGLTDPWVSAAEGPETWSPFLVVGHLVHGERTDWVPRAEIILSAEERPFEPFDRFAMLHATSGRDLDSLLEEFTTLRRASLTWLSARSLTPADLERTGRHPELGPVTLRELLAAWVVHDLGHIAQIARVMAGRFGVDVGPWKAYLPVLAPRQPGT